MIGGDGRFIFCLTYPSTEGSVSTSRKAPGGGVEERGKGVVGALGA